MRAKVPGSGDVRHYLVRVIRYEQLSLQMDAEQPGGLNRNPCVMFTTTRWQSPWRLRRPGMEGRAIHLARLPRHRRFVTESNGSTVAPHAISADMVPVPLAEVAFVRHTNG